ncbi:unnamed protein product [Camellia sinensis]
MEEAEQQEEQCAMDEEEQQPSTLLPFLPSLETKPLPPPLLLSNLGISSWFLLLLKLSPKMEEVETWMRTPFPSASLLSCKSLEGVLLMYPRRWISSGGVLSGPTTSTLPKAYTQIFRAICRRHHDHEIIDLLNSMKRDGVVLDSGTFKLLLDAFIQMGKFDFALEILDHMEEELGRRSSCLNSDVYNSVLVALVRKEQMGLALSIFFKLLEASNGNDDGSCAIPDAIVCNELFIALRKADMRDEFTRVFDKLREKKQFALDLWGYNICIHAFGCWGDLGMSLSLFREMKERSQGSDGSFGPDLCTYNSLIHILCLAGKVKDALIVWEELKDSSHEPDASTYRIIIQGCCKSYRIDDATKIFSEMQHNGFCPDNVVYNSLLDGLLKARRLTEACQLFEKMVEDGVRASCWTYNILIDGLFKNGRAVDGYTLFCDLKKKGPFVDGITYSIVI